MRRLDNGTAVVLTVVFGTWASDTVAYFSGRFFGQTPMTPVLSPNKTWEGFAGGVIGTLVLVEFIGLYTVLTPMQSLYLGLVIAFVAPVGDLFESLIKRDAQIKDAGQLFPGHGGVLDRFDALLFVQRGRVRLRDAGAECGCEGRASRRTVSDIQGNRGGVYEGVARRRADG